MLQTHFSVYTSKHTLVCTQADILKCVNFSNSRHYTCLIFLQKIQLFLSEGPLFFFLLFLPWGSQATFGQRGGRAKRDELNLENQKPSADHPQRITVVSGNPLRALEIYTLEWLGVALSKWPAKGPLKGVLNCINWGSYP